MNNRYATVLVKSSLSIGAKLLVLFCVGFVVPAQIIAHLGLETYGAWVLLLSLVQFVNLADFGLQPSIARFVAEYDARNELEKFADALSTALSLVVIMFLCVAAILLAFMFVGLGALQSITHFGKPILVSSLVMLLFVFGLGLVDTILAAMLDGMHRMELTNLFVSISQLVNAVVILSLLACGWKIGALLLAAVAAAVSYHLLLLTSVRRLLKAKGKVVPIRFTIQKRWIKEVFYVSSGDTVGRFSGLFLAQSLRVGVAAHIGLAASAIYDLTIRYVNILSSFSLIYSTPLVIIAPAVVQTDTKEKFVHIYETALKHVNITFLLFLGITFVFARAYLPLWLPHTPTDGLFAAIMVLLSMTYFSVLGGPAYNCLIGFGKPSIPLQYHTLNTGLCIVFVFGVSRMASLQGVIWGQATALAIASIFAQSRFYRLGYICFNEMVGNLLKPVGLMIALIASFWGARYFIGFPPIHGTPRVTFPAMALFCAIDFAFLEWIGLLRISEIMNAAIARFSRVPATPSAAEAPFVPGLMSDE